MGLAEDSNKVSNIVTPNLHHFRSLYEKILDNEEHLLWNKSSGKLEQIPNFATRSVSSSSLFIMPLSKVAWVIRHNS